MDIAELGIRVDSKGTVSAEADLSKLTAAAGRAEAATESLSQVASKRLTPAMSGVTDGTAKAGQGARMMAQQLSQVAQQGQATGNYIQALAIQLPDIGMAFGAVGIAAGVVASVALPGVMRAFAGTTDAADNLVKTLLGNGGSMERVNSATSSVVSVQQAYSEALRQSGGASGAAASLVIANSEKEFQARKQVLAIELELLRIRSQEQQGDLANLTASYRAQADANARPGLSNYPGMGGAYGPNGEGLGAYVNLGARNTNELFGAGFAESTARSELAIRKLRAELDLTNGTIERTNALMGTDFASLTANGGIEAGAGKSGGKGGGAWGGAFENRLKTLAAQLQGERAQLEAWFAESEKILNDRRTREFLGEQGHKDAMIRLEAEYYNRLRGIQSQETQQRLGDISQFWGAMGGIIAAGGGQATKAYAAVMGAQAVISAYAGAADALTTKGVPWWTKLAAYATVLSTGLGAAASIRSAGKSASSISAATYSAASMTSSIANSQVAAQGTTATPEKTLDITIKGLGRKKTYTGEELEEILHGLVEITNLRGVKFI